jgi:hypothetical protein
VILAMSRPDAKKNITTLVKAYGKNKALREIANLVLVMGNREVSAEGCFCCQHTLSVGVCAGCQHQPWLQWALVYITGGTREQCQLAQLSV